MRRARANPFPRSQVSQAFRVRDDDVMDAMVFDDEKTETIAWVAQDREGQCSCHGGTRRDTSIEK